MIFELFNRRDIGLYADFDRFPALFAAI
ncbi:MAG: hypothetical protein K0R28_1301, partial [Paenibacillus sp.]|nr:hypothetical protein [Paenibacillus sp.]